MASIQTAHKIKGEATALTPAFVANKELADGERYRRTSNFRPANVHFSPVSGRQSGASRCPRRATTGPSTVPQKHHVGLARRDRHAIISIFPTRGLFRHAQAWLRIPQSCALSSRLF